MKHKNWILMPLMMIFWLSLFEILWCWNSVPWPLWSSSNCTIIKMLFFTAWTLVLWDRSNKAKFTVISLSYYRNLIIRNIKHQHPDYHLSLGIRMSNIAKFTVISLSCYIIIITPKIGLSPVLWDQNEQHSQVHSLLRPQVLPITLKMSVTYI